MKIYFSFFFCFLGTITLSQNIAIENPRTMNIIYPWRNELTVVVENIPCSQLHLKTDNGNIDGGNCNYSMIPESIGRANIFIYQINGRDTILLGEKKFRVKRFPLSKPYLGIKNSGLISLSYLKAQLGVMVRIDNFDIDAKVKVTGFRITIIRNDEILEQFQNNGAKFNDAVRKKWMRLKSKDRILIDRVFVRSPGVKESFEVENSEFIIE